MRKSRTVQTGRESIVGARRESVKGGFVGVAADGSAWEIHSDRIAKRRFRIVGTSESKSCPGF